jgi:hypothetical protein
VPAGAPHGRGKRTRATFQTLNIVELRQKTALTPEMALRIEMALIS